MSYADQVFMQNIREILDHGVWDTSILSPLSFMILFYSTFCCFSRNERYFSRKAVIDFLVVSIQHSLWEYLVFLFILCYTV